MRRTSIGKVVVQKKMQESKGMLSRLYAGENLAVVHDSSAQTASFDVQNRVLYLPVWTNITDEMYDMFCSHEASHARFTPGGDTGWSLDTLKKVAGGSNNDNAIMVAKQYLNVVEDARIERMIMSRYRGLPAIYKTARKDFHTLRDAFGIREILSQGKSINDLPLIDRINLYAKDFGEFDVVFSDEEQKFVDRLDTTISWTEVVALATDLYEFAKHQNQNQQQQSQSRKLIVKKGNSQDGQSGEKINLDDYDEIEFDDSDSDGGEDANERSSDDRMGSDEHGEDSDGGSDESVDGTDGDSGSDGNSSDVGDESEQSASGVGIGREWSDSNEFIPEASVTEKNFEQALKDLAMHESNNTMGHLRPLPKYNLKDRIVPAKHYVDSWDDIVGGLSIDEIAEINDIIGESRKIVNHMGMIFDQKRNARGLARTQENNTGRLDMGKVALHRTTDNVFKTLRVEGKSKNHGMIMLIDGSGSMRHQIADTILQVANLVMFCQRVQIPFEVYMFSGTALYRNSGGVRSSGKLIQFVSSDMSSQDIAKTIKAMVLDYIRNGGLSNVRAEYGKSQSPVMTTGGGTPLNEATIIANQRMQEFRRDKKIDIMNMIYLTDGGADDMYGSSYRDPTSGRCFFRNSGISFHEFLLSCAAENFEIRNINFYIGRPTAKQEEFDQNGWIRCDNYMGYDSHFAMNGARLALYEPSTGSVTAPRSDSTDPTELLTAARDKKQKRRLINEFVTLIAEDL